ncbi:MAG: amidohydrolase, partial [Pseudomonadota bacterium]|nr:amidohydrolase [Pseudomonadota bacterium]
MTDAATSNALPPVVALRRRFHARPELGFLEYGIAAEAASTLTALGWTVQAGPEVMRREAMLGVPGAEAIAAARARALAEGADPAWIARMPDGMTGVVGTLDRGPGP